MAANEILQPLSDLPELDELSERLAQSSRLSAGEARHLVQEVLAFLGESLEQFVRRRHRQLQREGRSNEQIYRQLALEAACRPFRAPALSARQVRRLIYG
jgi:hypothetical protein